MSICCLRYVFKSRRQSLALAFTFSILVIIAPLREAIAGGKYITLTSNGVRRDALVYLPSTYNGNQPFPLLLAFHGSNGTGAGMARITGFDAQADRYGFVVVYPDSNGPRWDNRGTSDLQFVQALLVALAGRLSLDPHRVYASGYSDGGGFAQMLVCMQAGSYAGVATVGTNMGNNAEARCQPSQPVTYLTFHGTADPIVPYDGGPGNGPYAAGHVTNSTAQVFQFWAHLDGCLPILSTRTIPDRLAGGASVTDPVAASAFPCRNDTGATFYTITGGGHTWPGGTQTDTKRLGDVSKDVNASAIIMETLGRHRSVNACFEGMSVFCRIAYGSGRRTCADGQLSSCEVASCERGFVPRGETCVATGSDAPR